MKIKVYKCVQMDDKIEFDVFFGKIPNNDKIGKELTINWQAINLKSH